MVDGAEHGLAAVGETKSAAPQGDAGRVVVGAVDGVDKPGPAAWLRAPLLGDDAVLRAGGAQPVDDQRLSGVIGWMTRSVTDVLRVGCTPERRMSAANLPAARTRFDASARSSGSSVTDQR